MLSGKFAIKRILVLFMDCPVMHIRIFQAGCPEYHKEAGGWFISIHLIFLKYIIMSYGADILHFFHGKLGGHSGRSGVSGKGKEGWPEGRS